MRSGVVGDKNEISYEEFMVTLLPKLVEQVGLEPTAFTSGLDFNAY